jgi:hypothetical protein
MVEHITHNPKSEVLNPVTRTGGLYYKNITIINDDTSWSVTLESSIMILESSISLLDNIYSTGFTHGEHHNMFIVQAKGETGWQKSYLIED